jgi:serine/threonine protein kinase
MGSARIPPEVILASQDSSRQLGRYILIERIGKGGMGEVWKAWERNTSRFVAIKFLTAKDDADVMRFQREAELAANLDHPNIAPIYGFEEQEGRHYLVMKYIDGTTLLNAKLPMPQMLSILQKVCETLDFAHQKGVIHRDLKPVNIMLTSSNWPYVMDFGLAKNVDAGTTVSAYGMIMGTPQYMAPEQAQGLTDKVDARSDVYALGATMYHMLAGNPPFTGASALEIVQKVVRDDPVPPRKLNSRIDPDVENIILKALSKDPAQRYASAGDMARDLQTFLQGGDVVAKAPSSIQLMKKAIKRRMPAILAMLLALAVAGGGTLFFLRRAQTPAPGPVVTPAPAPAHLPPNPARTRISRAREPLTLLQFRPEDPENPKHAARLLSTLREEGDNLTLLESREVSREFREQAQTGQAQIDAILGADRSVWPTRRADAKRLIGWARILHEVLEQAEPFREASAPYAKIRADAQRVLDYAGQATLRIHVLPYARLVSMKSGERWVIRESRLVDATRARLTDPDLTTPIKICDMEIDDYELELDVPGQEPALRQAVKIAKNQMEHNREYILTGRMDQKGSIVLR